MKCKNCGHTIQRVSHQKDAVLRLFNGQLVHKNIGGYRDKRKTWAVICRVKRCGCMKPEEVDKV